MKDYFAVFGIARSASDKEVRDAYRRLAKMYHPDANQSTPEAIERMQAINEAKAVLFDPVKREEHRVMLKVRERMSDEQMERLRRHIPTPAVTTYRPPQSPLPNSKWNKLWSRWLTAVVVVMFIATVGIVTYETTRPAPVSQDPIQELIARYSHPEKLPFDAAPALDTMTIREDSLPILKRRGDILFGLGEYRSASKYYEKYLKGDSTDESVVTNLSFAYFKRGRYAQSLEVLSRNMKGDSNLVVAYYNIGQLFMHEDKPFDARNAFKAALQIADKMHSEGKVPPRFILNARSELAKLE